MAVIIPTRPKQYDLLLDDTTTASTTYIGEAEPGSSQANPVWRIKKINETSGVVITWADDNEDFDNIWNDRATLSY